VARIVEAYEADKVKREKAAPRKAEGAA
jgi:hypothetical protein